MASKADDPEYRRLEEEYSLIKLRMEHGEVYQPRDFDYGLRWVLVNVFGHKERYHMDQHFHMQVHLAENMIREIHQIAEDRERRDSG